MIATAFDEENDVLGKPADMSDEQCEVLSVWRGRMEDGIPVVISCWKMSAEELEKIKKTGRVWLMVVGNTMPPVALNGQNPFQTE